MTRKWFMELGFIYHLFVLEEYLEISEDSLVEAQANLEEWIVDKKRGLSPEELREFFEFENEDRWRYEAKFPRLLRNSFLVSCWSLLEREIYLVCKSLRKDKQIPIKADDLRYDFLERSKLYFQIAGLSLSYNDGTWQELNRYYKIRNCIVHNHGLVDKYAEEQDFMRYAEQKGIISKDTIEKEIALTKEFCKEVIETIRRFGGSVSKAYGE